MGVGGGGVATCNCRPGAMGSGGGGAVMTQGSVDMYGGGVGSTGLCSMCVTGMVRAF